MLKTDADRDIKYNGNNWAYQVKTILNELGMSDIWYQQNNTVNLAILKQRITDTYTQSWYASINNSRRLKSYCIFKHNFSPEKYTECIKTNKTRIALTRFRVSSHDLAIETGRYNNIDVDERKCIHCQMNAIENEYHFLLVCPKYRDLRRNFFKPYYCHWPTLAKFETLMSDSSTKMINSLAKFIYHAFQLRSKDGT